MTDQPTNPLILAKPPKPGRITVEMLHDYAAEMNRSRWVKDSGKLYFVNRRTEDDGAVKHFLDRHY